MGTIECSRLLAKSSRIYHFFLPDCLMASNMRFPGSPLLCVVIIATFAFLGCVAPSSQSSDGQSIRNQIDDLDEFDDQLLSHLKNFRFNPKEGGNEFEALAEGIETSVQQIGFALTTLTDSMRLRRYFQTQLRKLQKRLSTIVEQFEKDIRILNSMSHDEDHLIVIESAKRVVNVLLPLQDLIFVLQRNE